MKRYLLLWVPLAAVPQLLNAQTTSVSDPRPFFAELRSASNLYEIKYLTTINEARVNSFPITVGYYFTPRLAVQISGAYRHQVDNWTGATLTTTDGVYSGYGSESYKSVAVPITVRYALYKRQSRLRVDALAGVSWAHDSFSTFSLATFKAPGGSTIPLRERRASDEGSQFFVTAGASLRWVFNRHFELVGDLSWNRNLSSTPDYVHQQVTGNKFGLTTNTSFGLRYRFNLRKPALQPTAL